MTTAFQPLAPTKTPASASDRFRVKRMPGERAKPAFVPLGAASRTESAANPPSAVPAPVGGVTFEREGDVIKMIQVRCSCGQVTHLTCDYADAAA